MRTYDKLIAAIFTRQGTVGLRSTFGRTVWFIKTKYLDYVFIKSISYHVLDAKNHHRKRYRLARVFIIK